MAELQCSSSSYEEPLSDNPEKTAEGLFEKGGSSSNNLLLDTSLWKQSFEEEKYGGEEDETKNFVNLDLSTLSHQVTQFADYSAAPAATKSEGLSSLFGPPSSLDESNYNNCLDVLFYPEDLFPPDAGTLPPPVEDQPQAPPDFLSSSDDITPVSNIIEDMGDLPFVSLEAVDSVNSSHHPHHLHRDNKVPPSHMADVLLSLKNPVVHPDSPPPESWQAFEPEHQLSHTPLADSGGQPLYGSYGENPWTSPQAPPPPAHHHHTSGHDFFPNGSNLGGGGGSVALSVNNNMGLSPSHFSPYGFQEQNIEGVNSNWGPQYGGHCGYASSSSSTSSTSSNLHATNGGYFGGHHLYSSGGGTELPPKEDSPPYLNTSTSSRCYPVNYDERKILKDPSSPDSSTDNTKNVCGICGKTYARPSTLKTHMRTHSGERPYRCYDCDKSFSQAANLTAHCRTHSGEKPFHCSICNRKFSQSSSVTTHMRTHSGERPYRCRMCKKAFSDSSTLTKHLRIHSGEKPYQCKLCHLKFSQSGNLNRHMRIHAQSGR